MNSSTERKVTSFHHDGVRDVVPLWTNDWTTSKMPWWTRQRESREALQLENSERWTASDGAQHLQNIGVQ